jgi:putative sterol carrier protein
MAHPILKELVMTAIFPSEEWLRGLEAKLNSDSRYADIAKNWEGDLFIIIEPSEFQPDLASRTPVFTLTADYDNVRDIMTGKLNPMTAMMTMKLKVKGNLGYMMRNVPTVLDFVRCAQEVTTEIL